MITAGLEFGYVASGDGPTLFVPPGVALAADDIDNNTAGMREPNQTALAYLASLCMLALESTVRPMSWIDARDRDLARWPNITTTLTHSTPNTSRRYVYFTPKLPFENDEDVSHFETEKRIYRRLGTAHPHIIPCLGIVDGEFGGRIYLKYAEHCAIRVYFRKGGKASLAERVRWAGDLASAIHYIHEKGVRQGDIGGCNVLLDTDRNIFSVTLLGPVSTASRPIVWAEGGFRHPGDTNPQTRTGTMLCELHALGSTIYELITSKLPHRNSEEDWAGEAVRLLCEGKYPDVSNVVLGDIIQKCWKTEFTSAQQVADSIYKRLPQYVNDTEMFGISSDESEVQGNGNVAESDE
ncbi:hypothetical protein SCUCBS95973_005729 [Sporothrix curviconia]|uniref:Protein kinase domain-containing protein n=1 Tax=Sporothrix curviconia TaxID=1260050 RepID=A0ABP0C1I9_9PEZI